ncbi:MAG: glycine zipper 2TM domain-containing protein [Holosporales bacterium]|jgi:outer membrane lipoprotein SlyB|nr:glycine zipper 2TM domain-containing protein [Holosporales bacterium]
MVRFVQTVYNTHVMKEFTLNGGSMVTVRHRIWATLLVLALTGCSSDYSGDSYTANNVGEVARSDHGVIISMRKIKIDPDEGIGSGAVLGAVGGGLVGSLFGKGKGKLLTTAAGAAAGGVAGHSIQNRKQDGFEYTVKLDTGAVITLAQGTSPALSVGQNVFVVNSTRGRSRIVPE